MTGEVRVCVLASGSGSNLQALIDADLGPARIVRVVVNVASAGAAERAERAGIPTAVISHRAFETRAAFDAALASQLERDAAEWVVLAGFMRLLGPPVLNRYAQRVVNVHPSLLPAFPGMDAQRQALAAGVRISGCTIHLVDAGVDTGPILAQAAVPVLPSDDLEALRLRILGAEHRLLPIVVRSLATDGLSFSADGRPHLALEPNVRDEPLMSPTGASR